MGQNKRIAINMVAQFLAFVINISINFFLTPYITEHVGKEVYGFVNLAFQTTGYITILTTALNAMVGRYITLALSQKNYQSAKMYFSSVIVANVCITVVLLIPSVVAVLFLDRWLQIPFQYVSDIKFLWGFIFLDFFLALCFNCYGVSTYASNRLDLAAKRNTESIFMRAVLLVALFALFPARVWYVGLTKLILGFYVITTNIYYTKKLTPELTFEKQLVKFHAIKELIQVGIWNTVQQISAILINGCDMLITNIFVNASSMTLMGFAKTMPNYLMSIIGIVSNSFGPQMTILYGKGDLNAFTRYTKSAIKVCGFICSIPILGFIVFGTHFFSLWIPVLETKEIQMVQILSIMILSQTVFDVYIYPLYTVNSITAKLKIPVLVSIGIGVVNILGSILLCKYTNLGVYAIQIVSSVLLTARVFFFAPLYAAHILKQKWWTFYVPLFRGMVATIFVIAVFGFIESMVKITSWASLILWALVCCVLGYAINYLIVLNKTERKMVKELLLKKIKRKSL